MLKQVLALGTTQTIAWASSTYLIAILAAPIARELGLATSTVFGAFSVALLVMAVTGPVAGRAIDRWGGRGVLILSNGVLACGLLILGAAGDPTTLFIAWCVLGVGMALGLYEAAFATLVRLHGTGSRSAITGVTLIAGFASTVGWPLTAFLTEQYDWRTSCFVWAGLHLFVAMPMNAVFLQRLPDPASAPDAPPPQPAEEAAPPSRHAYQRAFVLLALFGGMTSYVTSAMAAHLPGLLVAVGTTTVAALAAAALLGPAQVAARLLEFVAMRRFRFHPLLTARLATACHPLAGVVLALFGGPPAAASFFALTHGAGNGMITIAKGTLPLAIFGAAGYGERQGLLSIFGRGMQAVAPFTFGVVLEAHGARMALTLSVALSLVALLALFGLPRSVRA